MNQDDYIDFLGEIPPTDKVNTEPAGRTVFPVFGFPDSKEVPNA